MALILAHTVTVMVSMNFVPANNRLQHTYDIHKWNSHLPIDDYAYESHSMNRRTADSALNMYDKMNACFGHEIGELL